MIYKVVAVHTYYGIIDFCVYRFWNPSLTTLYWLFFLLSSAVDLNAIHAVCLFIDHFALRVNSETSSFTLPCIYEYFNIIVY